MEGRWGSHPQYGKQFTGRELHDGPARHHPGHPPLPRLRPDQGHRARASPTASPTHFGVDTLDIIEQQPKRLVEVPGLGPKRTKMIAAAWEEQKAIKEVMVFLQSVGVSTSIAVRIYKKYGDASISVVKNQPYRLAADVWGIGFLTADRIAQAVGIPHDSPERVKAGLQYALSQSTDQGHCFLPEERLIADGGEAAPGRHRAGHRLPGRARRRTRRASYGRRCRAPRTGSRSPPSTWSPSTAPSSPSPPRCGGCCGRRRTGCRPSGTSTGTRR